MKYLNESIMILGEAGFLKPGLVQKYNGGMGGVDLLDNLVACYRIP